MHLPTPGSPFSKEQMPLMAQATPPALDNLCCTRPKFEDGQWMHRPTLTGKRQGQNSNCVFLNSICLFDIR